MIREKMRRGNRGVVLIVIVGVLAILSLLAATFGMIARVELAASRNQTEYEMAREAAHAGAEYLINALQSVGPMTSGPLPVFLPNTVDTDGMLLYKRDGVKVYFAINDRVPTGSVTPDWLQGLGAQDAGMFNLNAMGFANDLGSNCNPDIRYTSFDCSLVRLLTSRFASITTAPINSNDMGTLLGYYPVFNTANEQQRVAILLSRAIINWRHGPDGVPGAAGTEERRLGHLPRWNSKLGCTNVNAGVGYPAATGDKYDWGWSDGLPSLFINATNILGPTPWSYAEPGVWTSYLGGGNWGDDNGLPVPGLFWGKMAAGSNALMVTADITQPGWRDWPAGTWNGYEIYVATGPCKGAMSTINTSTANTLTFGPPGLVAAPTATGGDAFCIFFQPTAYQPGAYVGVLNMRWNSVPGVEGDLVPNAMLWPNGTLATEGNVLDLVLDSGVVSDAGNSPTIYLADTDAVQAKTWLTTFPQADPNNTLIGKVVHIYGGFGRGQVRTIVGYTDNTLTLSKAWTAGNVPTTPWTTWSPTWITSNPCQYRIELPDNNLPSKFQPNNLQGDDRLYLSLGDLRDSVVVPALVSDGLSTANAQAVADVLLPYVLPYLSVSTQAIQASQTLCSINDWAVDGVDNDANGVVDDPLEAQYEQSSPQGNANRAFLANKLYNSLSLYTWVHYSNNAFVTTRAPQAAQLVANIIDFRDATDVPTKLTNLNLNETTPFIVYGAKGLHVTQVMPSPDAIYSAANGAEMTSDGQNPPVPSPQQLTDGKDWDWNGGSNCWQVTYTPDLNPVATFTFSGLKPGYYAMRLIGSAVNAGTSPPYFTVTYPPTSGTSTGTPYYASTTVADPEGGGWYTGFVRKGFTAGGASGRLACFQVASDGTLSFQLQAPVNAQFRGFALCAQYIQLTNISTHDIQLCDNQGHSFMTVTTDQSPTYGPILWQASGNYVRADNPADPVDLRRIPGAAVGTPGFLSDTGTLSTATYPINYGTYVICMSEESYEKQWSAQTGDPDYSANHGFNGALSTNGDGIWGNARNEAYPIYPLGDLSTDAQTMVLLMGAKGTAGQYQPTVTVKDAAGDLIAGGPAADGSSVDGKIPSILDNVNDALHANCYSAIEKTMVLQPTWDVDSSLYSANKYWRLYIAVPVALAGSQNMLVIGQDDSPRVPSGASFRACLNKSYGYDFTLNTYVAIWDHAATPTWDNSASWTTPPPIMWNTAKRWATLIKPSDMVTDPVTHNPKNQVFPIILNRPYATTGWLGLVPTSNTDAFNVLAAAATGTPVVLGSWRTIDPNPNPPVVTGTLPSVTVQVTPPATPEQLLGTLMSNATVGGVYARFNINTAPLDTLKTVFPDATAQAIVNARSGGGASPNGRQLGVVPTYSWYTTGPALVPALANASWANWDELLNDPIFQYARNDGSAIGFLDDIASGISNADAGAGTYADGFPDSSNEKKEWFMRFSNLFCLQSTSYQFTVAGLVYKDQPWDPVTMQNNEPVAMVRIEVELDLSTGIPNIVHFRYLTQ